MSYDVLIVGAGQAGVQTAMSLRTGGFTGTVGLLGAEDGTPYQRPPLSKNYLLAQIREEEDVDELVDILSPTAYVQREIDLRPGESVLAINRERRTVRTSGGENVGYGKLVLATGARSRTIPVPEEVAPWVHYLRTRQDADRIAALARGAQRAVVIGGGFIGMEAAGVLGAQGLDVHVIEGAARPMNRGISELLSDHLVAKHLEHGVHVNTRTTVTEMTGTSDGVRIETTAGTIENVQIVIVGVGVAPEDGLAAAAGLKVDNGILVDETLRTTDPNIFAVGDCARFPTTWSEGAMVRLESVQNATDQARHIARSLVSDQWEPYRAVPWFWTEQWDYKVQMVGLVDMGDDIVVVGDTHDGKFSIFSFRAGRLIAVESVNRPRDHMLARKLLGRGRIISHSDLAAVEFDLSALPAEPKLPQVEGVS